MQSAGKLAYQNAKLQRQFKKQAEILLLAADEAYRHGNHADAQALCRQILQDLPDHFDALQLLGVSELDCRQFDSAERTLTLALSIQPSFAETHFSLGMVLFNLRRYGEARTYLERAVALRPDFPMALTNLGNTLMRLGLLDQAVDAHDRAIRLDPDYADAHCNRGMALLGLNRYDQADPSFDRALSYQPHHLQALLGKGIASLRLRHSNVSLAAFNAVLAIKPDLAEVLTYRGWVHQQMGRLINAEADFDAAIAINSSMEPAWRGKATIRILLGDTAQAIAACMKALALNPVSEVALNLLGTCYARQGDIAAAIEHFDRALAIKPDYEEPVSKKIFLLDFAPDADFAVHQAARRAWWDAIGAKIPQRELHRPTRDPNKRIVVGYVSSDFRIHSAAFAFLPVLRSHDRRTFEINFYSCSPQRDVMTEEFRALADTWVEAAQLSDDELADRIVADGVDILVDLSGHSEGNRLTVFARKAAPVQVTAWGHATGTGLATMDYLFSDPVAVPEAVRHLFAEKIYDLPCLITMAPLPDLQHATALPMVRNGYVTFGVFNRIDKISNDALAVWSRILEEVKGSRIVIKAGALDDALLRDGLIARFVAHGIPEDRITCLGGTPRGDHFAELSNVDISLDPFPQTGGVSTFESLQLGVPVITKLGNSIPSRVGGAIVKAFDLDDWVAEDEDGYVAIARKFASAPSDLAALRADLPVRIAASPAGNAEIYTRRVEEGYRQFWRDYCDGKSVFQGAWQQERKEQAESLLSAAITAYRHGNHADAQALCRQILQDLPDHFDALQLLGVSELDCRQFDSAERTLTLALSIQPQSAEVFCNLGVALFNLKRYQEARKYQEQAIALKPDFPMALTNLGNTLMRLGLVEQAIDAHDRAVRLDPGYADAYCNRGMSQLALNRSDEAALSFDSALSLQPRHFQAMVGNGLVALNLRHFDAAQTVFDEVLAIKPDFAEVLTYRGRVHQHMGRFAHAEADFDAALAIDPTLDAPWVGKALNATISGDNARAMSACRNALEQNPASEVAFAQLGNCYAKQGDIAAAIEHFDRALAIKPDYEDVIMKKIFALDFVPDADFAVHQAARRAWWDAIGAKIPQRVLHRPTRDPNKRIVVGYISSDFRIHSAAFAFMPMVRFRDRKEFEIICYSCWPVRDVVTEEFRALADTWVEAAQLSDDELADRIVADGVDILVDLSGHSAGNRLTIFARKPAPVQVTAWGHATGTGLATMDYLFSDPVAVPEAVRHLFAEKIYDLPCLITMTALPDLQHAAALPMLRNGYITFGVFNRVDKISNEALVVWSRILEEVKGSRIVIKAAVLDDALLRDGLIARFVTHGTSEDRITCLGTTSREAHLAALSNVDISLDPFPQTGGVSTFESLQLGVPVITKLGNSIPSRVGGAIVKAFSLGDWVAENNEGYVAIARRFASAPSDLAALRADLPARIAASPAGNAEIYTRRVEEGYRQFWRDYCEALP